jgi:hypothetical protein
MLVEGGPFGREAISLQIADSLLVFLNVMVAKKVSCDVMPKGLKE